MVTYGGIASVNQVNLQSMSNFHLLVLVDEQPAGRLYLVFLRSQAERLAYYFGTVPIIMTLVAIYLVSWLTSRASKRMVSPGSRLPR